MSKKKKEKKQRITNGYDREVEGKATMYYTTVVLVQVVVSAMSPSSIIAALRPRDATIRKENIAHAHVGLATSTPDTHLLVDTVAWNQR